MKRFTDTEKWLKNKWFRELSPKLKCAWLYMCDNCDAAGVWAIDLETMSFAIGDKVTLKELQTYFKDNIQFFEFNGSQMLIIVDFIRFQNSAELNPKFHPHIPIFKSIQKYHLYEKSGKFYSNLYSKFTVNLLLQDMDKDMDIYNTNNKSSNQNSKDILFSLEMLPSDLRSEEIVKELNEWAKMRKSSKKPLNPHSAKLSIQKLVKLAGSNKRDALEIIRQSIIHNWQGLFPLKSDHVYITTFTDDKEQKVIEKLEYELRKSEEAQKKAEEEFNKLSAKKQEQIKKENQEFLNKILNSAIKKQ